MMLSKLSPKALANKATKQAYKERRDAGIVNLMLKMKEDYKALGLFPSTKAMTIELSNTPNVKISAKTIASIVGASDRWVSVKWVKPKACEIIHIPVVREDYMKFHTCAWSLL